MVTHDPLLRRWTVKKFNSTIINDVLPEVLFFTLISTVVSIVSMETKHKLGISNQMLTVLGTVLALVISFRTTSAYERYQDGRKMWTNITIASRNIAQMIWIHIPIDRKPYSEGGQKPSELSCIIEKKTMINLVQAFAVSVKHFLRGEPGIYYQDLYPLVCILPRYANQSPASQRDDDMLPLWRASESNPSHPRTSTSIYTPQSSQPTLTQQENELEGSGSLAAPAKTEMHLHSEPDEKASWYNSFRKGPSRRVAKFDPERVLPIVISDQPLKPARSPPGASFFDYFPIFRILKPILRLVRLSKSKDPESRTLLGRKKHPEIQDSNVPLEITLFLSSYLAWLLRNGLLTPAIATGLTNNIGSLQDTMSNLDRIRNTPIPFAYQVHLRMSLWLYLILLPFQVLDAFKYLTIPATAFASFLLLGFLEIGQEIENPFNYDLNDLDLDCFCLSIQRELAEITAHTSPDPDAFVYSAWNQPFAPSDRRTAEQLIGHDSNDPNNTNEYSVDGLDTEKGLPSIRRTLLRSWREVDELTRHHH
jgi:putative membrane protein